jgi:hypothetical protein
VKLGKNASDTFAVLTEAYGGEVIKELRVSGGHEWFRESLTRT